MENRPSNFDLALGFPQWQGSGRPDNIPRGAEAASEICGRYAPLERVPLTNIAEDLAGINRGKAIVEQFRAAQDILFRKQPKRILTAGGDCAVDVVIIDYLHRLYPTLTVLWVDAHLDANTPASTPSGNFHGMPVAAIMGDAPKPFRELLGSPLNPSQFYYVSAHEGDEGDWAFQRAQNLRWLEPDTLPIGPVHVHFDLDSLIPAEFPYVAYPDGQLSIEAGMELVRKAASFGQLVGLTITEFAPANAQEATAGSHLLERLCEATKTVPNGPGSPNSRCR